MCADDDRARDQILEAAQRATVSTLTQQLLAQPTPPVLLALPAQLLQPPVLLQLSYQTDQDQSRWRPEPSPVRVWSRGMHRCTVRAPIPRHPQPLGPAIQIPAYVSMSPADGRHKPGVAAAAANGSSFSLRSGSCNPPPAAAANGSSFSLRSGSCNPPPGGVPGKCSWGWLSGRQTIARLPLFLGHFKETAAVGRRRPAGPQLQSPA